MTGFSTFAVHGDHPLGKSAHGALRPPVYDSVAFEHESAEDINQIFTGRKPGHAYLCIALKYDQSNAEVFGRPVQPGIGNG